MQLVVLTFLVVLSGCGCSSGNETINQNVKVKTHFSDLNNDVLYIVFYKLEWEDFLNLVEVNSQFHYIVHEVIRRKYKQINQLRTRCTQFDVIPRFEMNQTQLEVHNIHIVLNVLKYFGNSFPMIKFEYYEDLTPTQIDQIAQYLNEYCASSVKKLELMLRQDLFGQFTKPFDSVEDLTINADFGRLNKTRPMSEIFPQLQRLTVWSERSVNYSFIRCEFRHLKHFSFYVNDLRDTMNRENIRELIRRNPAIRSIDARILDPNLIKFISQHLPILENLTILDLGNDSVRLENVKNLTIIMSTIDSIDNISVPRLQSLEIRFEHKNYHKFMDFLSNHAHRLRHLHVFNIFGSTLSDIDIDARFASLTNLTDVTFDILLYNIRTEVIVQFIGNHRKLHRCTFLGSFVTAYDQQTLREQLENEWDITFNSKSLSFERKLHPIPE